MTVTTPFSARTNHMSVVFNDMLWVIGGDDGTNLLNDIWYTGDAEAAVWTQITFLTSAPTHTTGFTAHFDASWSARKNGNVVVYNDKMYLIGGEDAVPAKLNDVWQSHNGHIWTQVLAAAPFSPRVNFTTFIFGGHL